MGEYLPHANLFEGWTEIHVRSTQTLVARALAKQRWWMHVTEDVYLQALLAMQTGIAIPLLMIGKRGLASDALRPI